MKIRTVNLQPDEVLEVKVSGTTEARFFAPAGGWVYGTFTGKSRGANYGFKAKELIDAATAKAKEQAKIERQNSYSK
jgi:hypothetical protein